MGTIKKKKCHHCRSLFVPDHRNRDRQKYCEQPACRKVSKAVSQKKWLNKPENRDYFRGPENAQRVCEWRNQNPGYWKSKRSQEIALQDPLIAQQTEKNEDKRDFADNALQDLLKAQAPVIIGLISNFIGSALQDDIVETLLRMQQSGQDILYSHPQKRGGKYDCKISDFTPTGAQSTPKLQLDRSPPGK